MNRALPISQSYRRPIFEAVILQAIIGVLAMMVLDGGDTAHICGISLIAFWSAASVLIWRHPKSPSKTDLQLLRFGYLPLVIFAGVLVRFLWHVRGWTNEIPR